MKHKHTGYLNKAEMAEAIGEAKSNFYFMEYKGALPSPGHQFGRVKYYSLADVEGCRIAAAKSRECDLVSQTEVARRLGMSRFNLQHHLHRGKAPLPTHKHPHKTGRHYTPAEADSVVATMRRQKTEKAGMVRIEMTAEEAKEWRKQQTKGTQ